MYKSLRRLHINNQYNREILSNIHVCVLKFDFEDHPQDEGIAQDIKGANESVEKLFLESTAAVSHSWVAGEKVRAMLRTACESNVYLKI